MKRVSDIRGRLAGISGAMYESDPEGRDPGSDDVVRTLWPEAEADAEDLAPLRAARPDYTVADEQGSAEDDTDVEELFEFGAPVDEEEAARALSGGPGGQFRQAVMVRGADGLAWYVSFHVKGAQWGIYVPTSSILYVALGTFGALPTDLLTRCRIAFRMMHQHELFHFAADTMATQFEGILERPCHRPARTLKDPDLGYNVLEEELANAHMLRALRGGRSRLRVRGRLEQARSFVAMQPPGYRDAPRSLAADTFRAGCEALAQRYASCIPGYSPRLLEVADLAAMYPVWPSVDWRQCPIHLIDDSRRYALPPIELELFREIDEIEETATFRRDLAALPRELRSAWDRVKARLRSTTRASGMDFKQWSREEPGATVYSVRLNKGYRAHLRYDKTRRSWSAIAVGDHAAMGHG